jgi:hypothetical protein
MKPADGRVKALQSDHPGWQIWESLDGDKGSGVFYATPGRRDPSHESVTLTENDPGRLGGLIRDQEAYWAGEAPAPPPQYGHLFGLTSR